MEAAQQSQLRTSSMEDEESDEIETENQVQGFYEKVYKMTEKLATTRLGQFVIERSDRLLKMIEDTAKWSLPQDKSEEKLIRPFNWITFLMLIITLRMIRITLSIAAVMIGNSPVSAHDMVYFIQTRRRKLRAVRVQGLKEICRKEMEANAIKSANSKPGIIAKLQVLLSFAICRPGQHREPERRVFVTHRRQQVCEEQSPSEDRQASKRPRDDENLEHNLTFDQLLTKYANENSDDDSDFQPNPEDETNEDDSTSSDNSSAAEEDSETNTEKVTEKSKTVDNDVIEVKENGESNQMPKPMLDTKIETLSDSEQSLTAKENGPISDGTHENEGNNVAEATPSTSTIAQKVSLTDHYGQNLAPISYKSMSTPGHQTAAVSAIPKPTICATTFGSTAKAASQNDDIPKISTSLSYCIQSLSSTTLLSEDLLKNFQYPESTTPQSRASLLRSLSTSSLSASEKSTLSSSSSTEDIFYSPIGSPPDFNAVFKPVSILKNPIVSSTEIGKEGNVLEHSTPKSSEEDLGNVESVDSSIHSASHKKHVHHQHPHRQSQHHQNRYRNKNRR